MQKWIVNKQINVISSNTAVVIKMSAMVFILI